MESILIYMAQRPGRQDTQNGRHRYMTDVNPADVAINECDGEESADGIARPTDKLAEPESNISIRMQDLDQGSNHVGSHS